MSDNEVIQHLFRYASAFGVIPDLALRYAYSAWWAWKNTNRVPEIVSGFRSPCRQAELIRRWESGNRLGLVAKPALRSYHMTGRAIDVDDDSPGFEYFRRAMIYYGARWGGNFQNNYDPVHFDLPGNGPRPTAFELCDISQTPVKNNGTTI